jgi:flagellar biosynthesis protein FlhA
VTIDPALEDLINGHLDRSDRGTTNTMPPHTAQQVVQRVADKVAELQQAGRSAVVLCNPQVRGPLRRMIETSLPGVAVLAYNEVVTGIAVEAVAMVGMNG